MNLNVKILVVAAVSTGLFLGIVFFVAVPLIADIENVRGQTIAREGDTAQYADRILRVRQFNEFTKKESANLEKVNNVLVESQMPLDFIHYLEEAAKAADVTVVFSPSISRKAPEGGWPALSFQADISGDISGILKFVKKIETSPYLVVIEGFSLAAGIGETGNAQGKPVAAVGDNFGTAHILLKAYAKE